MLLHNDHCHGKTSFSDMKIVDDQLCESYQDVCRKLGLLDDDAEWHNVLRDANECAASPALRALFITILLYCNPGDSRTLFEDHWQEWYDDFKYDLDQKKKLVTDDQYRTLVRLDIQKRLSVAGRDLTSFSLDAMTKEEEDSVKHLYTKEQALMQEELDFNIEELRVEAEECLNKFTPEQKKIYNRVINAIDKNEPLQIFISARGGCGKTYLLNTILKAVRSKEDQGCVALAMATTGIAAQLLHLGRTLHSRMKAPCDIEENSSFNIPTQSVLAKLVKVQN